MYLFLDACVIIYWVEAKEPFYTQFISILKKISDDYPKHQLAISRLSFLECLVLPIKEKNQKHCNLYDKFFQNPQLTIIELTAPIIQSATTLRAHYNLKTPDAIQAACALDLSSEVKFITNDLIFQKVPKLNVIHI